MQPITPVPIPSALTDADIIPSAGKILIVYGPLGVLALLALYAARSFYQDMRADRLAYAAAVTAKETMFATQLKAERDACEAERKQHVDELDKLRDRYIEKSESWMAKYNELSTAQNKVIESVFKSRSGNNGGS